MKLLRSIYPQIYKWYKKYALVASGDSFVIVARPHDAYGYAGVDKNDGVETVRRLRYFEATYSEIWRSHSPEHAKGCTLSASLNKHVENIDSNCVSYSPTRGQFVVITGLLNIELLGLQDRYLVGEMMNVKYEQEAAVNESSVEGQGDGDVTCNCYVCSRQILHGGE